MNGRDRNWIRIVNAPRHSIRLSAFLLFVLVPTAVAQQIDPRPSLPPGEAGVRVERFLEGATITAVTRRKPRYAVPFRRDLSRTATTVIHDASRSGLPEARRVRSFFAHDGRFMGAESVARIRDPRRLPPDLVEQAIGEVGNRITGPARLPDGFDIREVWEVVGTIVRLDEIREFNLYPVDYETPAGATVPVVIVNIWGPTNPLRMPDDLPDVLKNRIRIIYYVNRKTWEADNLL